ncbi:hypothetical protein [Dactylosporangium sp. NPDC000521]|uniref:hypothetical protein n=1 Tax=Dactylosporangium sp. NPDC000521 TaxID=3363975 RepID=UPI0036B62853
MRRRCPITASLPEDVAGPSLDVVEDPAEWMSRRMDLGSGRGALAPIRTAPAPVDRSTLVDRADAGGWAVELPRPVFIRKGERVWVDGDAVCVGRPDGDVIRYKGSGCWICRL